MTVWVWRGREKTLELNLGMHAEKLQGEIGVERSSRFVHVHVRCGVYQMCVQCIAHSFLHHLWLRLTWLITSEPQTSRNMLYYRD